MKTILYLFLVMIIPAGISAQNYPDCSNLRVENIYIDTIGSMGVTISNSCSDCTSGINACVYMQMVVTLKVPPYSEIASSDCYCLWGPENNNERTYFIKSYVPDLPPLSDINISFQSCGCDSLSFNPILTKSHSITDHDYKVIPNLVGNELTISTLNEAEQNMVLSDMNGKVILSEKLHQGTNNFNVSHIPNGIYILVIQNNLKAKMNSYKIVKP